MIFLITFIVTFIIQEHDFNALDLKVDSLNSLYTSYTDTLTLNLMSTSNEYLQASMTPDMLSYDVKKYANNNTMVLVSSLESEQHSVTMIYYIFKDYFIVKKSDKEYVSRKSDSDFDSSQFELSENTYYFYNNTLIRWINPQKRIISVPRVLLSTQESLIYTDYQTHIKKFNL